MPSDIAKVIYQAATDNKRTLRYVSGNDITPIIKLRTETSESKYLEFMRSLFNYKNTYNE